MRRKILVLCLSLLLVLSLSLTVQAIAQLPLVVDEAYLNDLPYYLDAFEQGSPVDGDVDYSGDYYHGEGEETVYFEEDTIKISFFSSLFFGSIAGLITIIILRASMNTRRKKNNAQDYVVPGSFHTHTNERTLLFTNTSKVSKYSGTTSRSSGRTRSGGGSSVHRSSGGRRHGGGGGRF